MVTLAQISSNARNSEDTLVALILMGLVGYGLWRFIWQAREHPSAPDPWDDQVKADLAKDDAVPLCHHCLKPHATVADFCSECGAAVGQYTNWLPFPQLFSLGHVLRLGTSGDFKRSPLTIAGFWLLALAEYTIFAPIYWIMLGRKRSFNRPPQAPASDLPPQA